MCYFTVDQPYFYLFKRKTFMFHYICKYSFYSFWYMIGSQTKENTVAVSAPLHFLTIFFAKRGQAAWFLLHSATTQSFRVVQPFQWYVRTGFLIQDIWLNSQLTTLVRSIFWAFFQICQNCLTYQYIALATLVELGLKVLPNPISPLNRSRKRFRMQKL